jgi:hypothetical protein
MGHYRAAVVRVALWNTGFAVLAFVFLAVVRSFLEILEAVFALDKVFE